VTTQHKIIGRFVPIGEEVGPRRAPFDVLTKESYEFKGRQGFKGLRLTGAGVDGYSVISEHWQFVLVEQEKV